jgi:hypothetical protein
MRTLATVPEDTSNLNKEDLPLLKFSFLLEDIRVRKCEHVIYINTIEIDIFQV